MAGNGNKWATINATIKPQIKDNKTEHDTKMLQQWAMHHKNDLINNHPVVTLSCDHMISYRSDMIYFSGE